MSSSAALNRVQAEASGFDVAVIGGGPAGCSAARLLAAWGYRVALITRPAPRPNLAESIPPSARRLLERLDWHHVTDSAGFVRSTGNTFVWEGRDAEAPVALRQALFEKGALGYQVDRGVLNRVFLQATAQSTVQVIDDATVIAVHAGVVRYRRDAGDGDVWARWVLDCSGRSSVIARLGWRRSEPRLRTLAIAGIWERTGDWPLPDPTHTVVESHPGGWAWSVPVSRTQRHVTVMLDPHLTSVAAHGALTNAYHAELARAPGLHALTRGASLVTDPFARDASPYGAHQVSAPNVLLVGDAASFVDPLSSYGIKKALASAWLAAVVVHTCLTDSTMLRHALELYEARERAMYDALEMQRVELAQTALGDNSTSDFWTARAERDAADTEGPNEDIDVDRLRRDSEIQSALDELKRRESITLTISAGLERVQQPTVRENRIVLEDRLRVAGFPRGLRYVRNIDLVALSALAPSASHVPDLYDAYCRQIGPVPLGDFLGALALLIGKGILEFA